MNGAAKQLPEGYPVDKHFNPSYNPWDQRLCVVPDGDFFTSINKGQAHVVTDEFHIFLRRECKLKTGNSSKQILSSWPLDLRSNCSMELRFQ